MTKSVGVHEAKTHLSRLLEQVERGEEIVITRRGSEVARLVPAERNRKRVFGAFRGEVKLPSDEEWAEMDREIAQDFEDNIDKPYKW